MGVFVFWAVLSDEKQTQS